MSYELLKRLNNMFMQKQNNVLYAPSETVFKKNMVTLSQTVSEEKVHTAWKNNNSTNNSTVYNQL